MVKVKNDDWILKAPMNFKTVLDKVRIERIKNGRDKEMATYKRLCLALSRHPQAIKDLTIADFPEEPKI